MKIIKYIIKEDNIPVLFGSKIVHKDVSTTAKSGGFLTISYDAGSNRFEAKCFGKSTSLNVSANSIDDKRIIEDFFNN